MNVQASWGAALLDPGVLPPGLRSWNHSDPARRLAVHRNNVLVSLVDALAQTFPVTRQLVGDTFFRAMGQVFVRERPPRTRVLVRYGDELPPYIARFSPAAELPYLADVARLEWLRLQALHAADALPMATEQFAAWFQDVEALPHLRWQLAPSLHLFRSPHAALSVWAAHQDGSGIALETVDTRQTESALVFRSGLDVMVLQIDQATAVLVERLLAGAAWIDAVDAAFDEDGRFDLPGALSVLIRHELFTGVQPTT